MATTAPKAQASYTGGQALPAPGTATYAQAQQMAASAPAPTGVSFSGGSALPPAGSAAYIQAQNYGGNGSGSYNPATGQLSITASPATKPVQPAQISMNPMQQPAPIANPATPQVNTGQPSPATADATPYTGNSLVDYLSAKGMPSSMTDRSALAKDIGMSGYTGTASQNTELLNKYRGGFAQLNASGQTAPATGGQARAAISNIPAQQAAPNYVNTLTAVEPQIDSIYRTWQEYMAPQNQRQSLTETYKSMRKDEGVAQLDTELLNMKNVIEGSEDDIRNEITKAGGFATESQVIALTNSRNKQLVKNYNTLLETRNAKNEYINTLIGLESKDREAADAQFDKRMNFSMQVMQYRDNMQKNALNMYEKVGWDNVYAGTGGNPYYVALAEKTAGLPAGSLANIASQTQQERNMSLQKENLQLDVLRSNLQTDDMQRNNIQSQINERNSTLTGANGAPKTLTGKPQTEGQSKANGYADRALKSNALTSPLDLEMRGGFGSIFPNALQTQNRQSYEQAKEDFITAVLRKESGAQISPEEFRRDEKKYFATFGDTDATIKQKQVARQTQIDNLYREANVARPALPGDIVESGGKSWKVGADGETLTEIK